MPGPYSTAVRAAITLQKELAGQFTAEGFPAQPRYIGGADIAFARSTDGTRTGAVGSQAIGIAIVWDVREARLVDAVYERRTVEFPYVPGLLSFREEPVLTAAIAAIRHRVDAWMFDGQGRAHPRKIGLATHMGIRLGVAAIGAAKSVLLGRYEVPDALQKALGQAASPTGRKETTEISLPLTAPLLHKGEEVARALWMKVRTEPMIISQGHRCTLDEAVETTVAATRPGEWMPEPTRLADELTKRCRDLSEADGHALVHALVHK